MKRYGVRISIRDTDKWVAGTILAVYDIDSPDFRPPNWGEARWLYLEIDLTDDEADLARNRKLKIDLSKLLPADVTQQRGIANRVNLHHVQIKERVFAHVDTLNTEERQIYAIGRKPNIDYLKTKTGAWRKEYDSTRKLEMKRKLIKGTNAIRNATADKVEQREDLTLPEKLAAIRFHKNLYINHKDEDSEKYRTMNEAGVWRDIRIRAYSACRHFRGIIKNEEDKAKTDIEAMGAKPEILKVFTGADLLPTPKRQHVKDIIDPNSGVVLPGVGILGVLLLLLVFLFGFSVPCLGKTQAPLDKYSTKTLWSDEGLDAYDPTYTVGDGKTYATIQAAIDAVPGDLSGLGIQTVEVYAKAPDDIYGGSINIVTNFSNPSAADYIHLVSMQAHGGLSQAAGGTGILIRGGVGANVISYISYTRIEGFEIGDVSHGGNLFGLVFVTGERSNVRIFNNIIHDIVSTDAIATGFTLGENGLAYNNIIYNIQSAGANQSRGAIARWPGGELYNNTVYKIRSSTGTAAAILLWPNTTGKNNYGHASDSSGTLRGFYWPAGFPDGTITNDNNISFDATAVDNGGTGNLINKAASAQFVNLTVGSENLHLKIGADCIDAGADISGIFNDDIDGDVRAVPWDVGADEFVPVVTAEQQARYDGAFDGLYSGAMS